MAGTPPPKKKYLLIVVMTLCSLHLQVPLHASVTKQQSPGLRTPYKIMPLATLPLRFPWQPTTEKLSH